MRRTMRRTGTSSIRLAPSPRLELACGFVDAFGMLGSRVFDDQLARPRADDLLIKAPSYRRTPGTPGAEDRDLHGARILHPDPTLRNHVPLAY